VFETALGVRNSHFILLKDNGNLQSVASEDEDFAFAQGSDQ
jgi:hypothetical protein